MESIKFEQYKPQIEQAINLRISQGVISDPSGFILLDGFINIQLKKEMVGEFLIGGLSVPSVAVVGKSTGLVYTFALKVLIPNIQI